MEANFEYRDKDNKWYTIHVDHQRGEVYFLPERGDPLKSIYRWSEKFWRNIETRPIQKESPKDTQVGGTHYKDMKIQPGEFIRANNLGWYEANVVKYVCRHKTKNGQEDIKKAIHYLELLLEEYNN